ncbi:MAG: hypothetical protein KC535_04480 [Nanoarchaeota archaeon]|nr:hypothetical protein [Nanoarchaeota archaeon]
MKILSFLDKLFDLTNKVESTVESVSRKTRKTVEKMVSSLIKSMVNMVILFCSLLLVIVGLIIFLSRYAPLEYVLLFVGLLGFLYLALQRISVRVR